MTPPLISSGASTRPMMNPLVRTAAKYSRLATVSTLCMAHLLARSTRNAHEDVVQRWLGHFETPHPGAAKNHAQHLLRVAVAAQAQFLDLPEIINGLHSLESLESGDACFGADPDRVSAVGLLDRG